MLYPSMTPSRFVSDLSGIWDFAFDNGKGMEEKWYEKPLAEPLSMPVPSSYNDLTESIINREHYGWVFYQKKISVPSFVKGQRVVLRCDAVTHHARIYLNGELLATHECGFLPFEVEQYHRLHHAAGRRKSRYDGRHDGKCRRGDGEKAGQSSKL